MENMRTWILNCQEANPNEGLASFDDDPDETGYSPELSLEEIERRVMRE